MDGEVEFNLECNRGRVTQEHLPSLHLVNEDFSANLISPDLAR